MDLTNLSGTIGASSKDIVTVAAGEVWTVFGGAIWVATGKITVSFFDASTNTTQELITKDMSGQFTLDKLVLNSGDKLIARMSDGGKANYLLSVSKLAAAGVEGFTPRGTHTKGAAYAMKDVVTKDGSAYVSSQNDNTNAPPGKGWSLLVAKGDKGDAGTNGTNGKDGADGDVQSTEILDTLLTGAVKEGGITYGAHGVISQATVGQTTIDNIKYTGRQLTQWRESITVGATKVVKTYRTAYQDNRITTISEVA